MREHTFFVQKMLWNQLSSEKKIRYCDLGIGVNDLFDIESAKYDASIYEFVRIFISDTSFGISYLITRQYPYLINN